MGRLIKRFHDGSTLEYDEGRIDLWCIYYQAVNEQRIAIKDVDIFTSLEALARKLRPIPLYLDFIEIYQQTTSTINVTVLHTITRLAKKYPGQELLYDYLLTYLYAGMVAEENREGIILKKRLKRLGIHQLLIEERPAAYAANFSRKQDWQVLELECKVRGF